MRRSAWLTALLCTCVAPLFAAPPPAQPPVPLLWKVSDHDNSLYLLGSFHMLHKEDYPLSKDIDDALADAEKVMFELSPDEMSSPTLARQLQRAAMRTDRSTLDSDLTPELRAKLGAWTQENAGLLRMIQFPPERLQTLEPWFVSLLMTIVEATQRGFTRTDGLDTYLANAARAANKPASGLETGAMQLAMLDGMSRETQVQMLADTLASQGDEHELDRLHRDWRNGDADALLAYMVDDTRTKYPELYRRMNVERNDAWVPALDALLKAPGGDDTLVVVGAMHLLGDDGVVEKLKRKGYTVERVCTACK